MVQTKAEAMASQMQGLTDAIADLNKNLTKKIDDHHADLGNRIGDVTVQIQTLEKKFDDDIHALKVANAGISKRIDTVVQNTHDRIEEVRLETGKRLDDLENDEQYKNAVATIDIQRKKIVSLEKSCHRGLQHGRSYNVEIDGLPVNIGDDPDQLEEAALKLFSAINVDIEDYEIDTIHRLNSKRSPKPVIVRFVSRKTVRALHDNKNKLKYLADLNLDIAGLNDESKIFIRASQCSYYKNLSYNCRMLKREGLVSRVFTGKDGRVSIKRQDGSHLNVTHESELVSNFPDFDRFDFSYDEHEVEEHED